MRCCARHGDLPGFQRLAQAIQHIAVELGQFIKEQHTVMGKANSAGACTAAAPCDRCA